MLSLWIAPRHFREGFVSSVCFTARLAIFFFIIRLSQGGLLYRCNNEQRPCWQRRYRFESVYSFHIFYFVISVNFLYKLLQNVKNLLSGPNTKKIQYVSCLLLARAELKYDHLSVSYDFRILLNSIKKSTTPILGNGVPASNGAAKLDEFKSKYTSHSKRAVFVQRDHCSIIQVKLKWCPISFNGLPFSF